MTKKHYLQRDGNGGLNISNSVAIITLTLIFLSMVISSSIAYGTSNNKVNTLQEEWDKTSPEYANIFDNIKKEIDTIENQIVEQKTDQARIEERLTNIDKTLQEIKTDVKDLKRDIQRGGI